MKLYVYDRRGTGYTPLTQGEHVFTYVPGYGYRAGEPYEFDHGGLNMDRRDVSQYVTEEQYERWRRVAAEYESIQDEMATAVYRKDEDWRRRKDAEWEEKKALRA